MNNLPVICPFSTASIKHLSALAINAAQQAGHYIAHYPREQLKVSHKSSSLSLSAQVVTEVDIHCEKLILSQLNSTVEQYQLAILAEENTQQTRLDNHPRLTRQAFWAIDPLDGTLPFIEGSEGYAVSIGLVNQQGQPLIGVVYLPFSGILYHAYFNPELQDYQSFKQHQSGKLQQNVTQQGLMTAPADYKPSQLLFYCDRSSVNLDYFNSLKAQLSALATQLAYDKFQVISSAGAVVNACSVLEGSDAIYLKLAKRADGGGSIWDFAATACIALGSHAWVSDSFGQALALNQQGNSFMNHRGVLYASNSQLAKHILKLDLNRQFSDV
ncbi:inositol-1-monophosphatase [Agarivorans sp. TSD2052]|uniref:3'(2'),5'-bisphosphate nucleotidase CysQ family protein n=1 Tax=Agarivorans sp. TSD2052 TaxID=2937286 RepID=UPI00200F5CEF|nr:inositol monophosphatase family protein [Agarivorans sp. TSD2052]UPW17324.1 inositol-1-monophosphatase [Agarivorans sp. TSD2052]